MLVTVFILNMNWFKKENFRMQRDMQKAEHKIRLKKLEKELGLTTQKTKTTEVTASNDLLSTFAPLLKNLDGDQIAGLIEAFTGNKTEEIEGGGGLGDLLTNFASENPEMVKGLLEGIKGKLGGTHGAENEVSQV